MSLNKQSKDPAFVEGMRDFPIVTKKAVGDVFRQAIINYKPTYKDINGKMIARAPLNKSKEPLVSRPWIVPLSPTKRVQPAEVAFVKSVLASYPPFYLVPYRGNNYLGCITRADPNTNQVIYYLEESKALTVTRGKAIPLNQFHPNNIMLRYYTTDMSLKEAIDQLYALIKSPAVSNRRS